MNARLDVVENKVEATGSSQSHSTRSKHQEQHKDSPQISRTCKKSSCQYTKFKSKVQVDSSSSDESDVPDIALLRSSKSVQHKETLMRR